MEENGDINDRYTWGDRIGDAAHFGDVREARNQAGQLFAAKFVRKEPGASRELLLAQLSDVRNIVPIVDIGDTADQHVLIMPMAEKSLNRHLEEVGSVSQTDAIKILVDIATALTDLSGKVVHRDLKPANVLLLDGVWCLTDFGISRYAEAATETGETRRDYMSLPYAAPEQVRGERATSATDVYALGVMAFELFEGRRPFDGSRPEVRQAHLSRTPDTLSSASPQIDTLVQECMYKRQEARPQAANVLARLQGLLATTNDDRWATLVEANQAEVTRRATEQAEMSRMTTEAERREQLHSDGDKAWERISDQFLQKIRTYLGAAELEIRSDRNWHASLNGANFGVSAPQFQALPTDPFDVVSTSVVSVFFARSGNQNGWRGRSHSLYFCDAEVTNQFGWYEAAFMGAAFGNKAQQQRPQEPFSLEPNGDEWRHAIRQVVGGSQVAWPFTRIEPGDCEEFVQRWLTWFAQATSGQLHRPNMLPEKPVDHSWRRG